MFAGGTGYADVNITPSRFTLADLHNARGANYPDKNLLPSLNKKNILDFTSKRIFHPLVVAVLDLPPRCLDLTLYARMVTVAQCSISNDQPAAGRAPNPAVVKFYAQPGPRQAYSVDRFISRRREYSLEAANYLLTKKPVCTSKKNQIDVFKQVDSIGITWRKKFMHRLMAKENVIPGMSQKRILRTSQLSWENKLAGSLAWQAEEPWDEECFEDGMWKSKPRRKPLIGIMDFILDIPGFQAFARSRFRLIDWSSRNLIAAAIHGAVIFYDMDTTERSGLKTLMNVDPCALKWSNDGNKLVICTLKSNVILYDLNAEKCRWTITCECVVTYNTHCLARCVSWSQNDQYIVTGCRGLLSVYSSSTGRLINSLYAHKVEILTLTFSPNYQYLITTANDTNVRIFLWPNLESFLDISYYESVKAVVWHPRESGILCIGGGLRDASLSLWNVNRQEPQGYRRVNFYGSVENLAWNKLSGELVVQWSYWEDRTRHTVVPLLGSLDHVVDVLPIQKDARVCCIMWNSDHTQLAMQAQEALWIWNFFGDEYQHRQKSGKLNGEKAKRREAMYPAVKEFTRAWLHTAYQDEETFVSDKEDSCISSSDLKGQMRSDRLLLVHSDRSSSQIPPIYRSRELD
ncbi:hypothetical protein KM043_011233 [Ampulex compressa]|nr:hypothetical protein KM043_011233 [Ampulex compressa]